jgi:ATP-dependent helicase HrpB
MFGPLVLEETPLPGADPAVIAEALAVAAAERGFRDLDWGESGRQFRARIARMHALEGAPWPDVAEAALAATAREWLAPYCAGMTKLNELKGVDVPQALLPGDLRRKLDAALPARIGLPGGRSAAVDYTAETPTLEARAQHLFGLRDMPMLAGGRVKLQVALLSPAGRPVAITADLAGFWSSGWADVRKDMRGRYPKHDWPEDPGGG